MEKRKEKSDQNAVAELTREGLYKENKWLWEENRKMKEENKKLREELSAYDREFRDEDKKAKNIFIDKNGKVVSGGEFRELC